MPKYLVLSPVDVAGVIYKTGELEADAELVQPLIESGSLQLLGDEIDFSDSGNQGAGNGNQNGPITITGNDNTGSGGENTGVLVGAVTVDGQVVDLKDMTVPNLKKLAKDMGVEGADQLKKDALVDAIKAVQLTVIEKV